MNCQPVHLGSMASSQTSINIPDLDSADKENVLPSFSSSLQYDGTCASKPRRPPTVTPKRFSRFFSPRNLTRTRAEQKSNANRRLKDITRNGVNSASSATSCQSDDRPTKRRKRLAPVPDTTPLSSPIKQSSNTPLKLLDIYEDGLDAEDSSEEEELPMDVQPPLALPVRIRRLAHRTDSQRLLLRTFGRSDISARGQPDRYAGRRFDIAANYYSTPEDLFELRTQRKSLPFCTASCNTNSMVAVGDEDGTVHMLDTASQSNFSKTHIDMKIHGNAIMDMAFSPCDYILATAGGDMTARIVDVQTQRILYVLTGHRSSVKQVKFHPENEKVLTTSARDGVVNVWDLRCSGGATQTLRLGYVPPHKTAPGTVYPYNIMLAGPAHRATSARQPIDRSKLPTDSLHSPAGVSITAIQHLSGSRGHLLLTASEQNSSLKLFDLRVAGRNTRSEKYGFEIPVACTPSVSSHKRQFGISALALSSDGARTYSVSKESTVWVYSTQHLILGSAPEMVNSNRRTRLAPPDQPKEGLGPLFGFRHPKLRVGSFYVRAAVRKVGLDQEELLAVGSQETCPILLPLDERHFREQRSEPPSELANDDSTSRLLFANQHPPIHKVGTALEGGHRKEVTSLAFAHGGELVTVSDDFSARCWRQDRNMARKLRASKDNMWRYAWAEAAHLHDDEEELC